MTTIVSSPIENLKEIVHGPLEYQIPENMAGVVRARQGSSILEIDKDGASGFVKLFDIKGPVQIVDAGGETNSHVSSPTIFYNHYADVMTLSGKFQLHGTDGFGFQGGTIKVGSTTIASVPYAGSYVYYFQNLEIPLNDRMWIDTLVTYLNPPSAVNYLRWYTGHQVDGAIEKGAMARLGMVSDFTTDMVLPEGAKIKGGDFTVEVYSI